MDIDRPRLREGELSGNDRQLEFFAYDTGWLETKNSGWRTNTPVVNKDKCVGCKQCYKYCPDGVIFMKDGKAEFDYDFCKGCGICEKICRLHAIEMKEVKLVE